MDRYHFIELHIVKTYLPYIQKVALAKTLNDATMYKWVASTDENGNPTKVKTDQIKINSHIRNLLFKRMVIENITPASIKEIERWENNPTKEELFSKPHIKYLRFLHPVLRPFIIENWDKIKLMKV